MFSLSVSMITPERKKENNKIFISKEKVKLGVRGRLEREIGEGEEDRRGNLERRGRWEGRSERGRKMGEL